MIFAMEMLLHLTDTSLWTVVQLLPSIWAKNHRHLFNQLLCVLCFTNTPVRFRVPSLVCLSTPSYLSSVSLNKNKENNPTPIKGFMHLIICIVNLLIFIQMKIAYCESMVEIVLNLFVVITWWAGFDSDLHILPLNICCTHTCCSLIASLD